MRDTYHEELDAITRLLTRMSGLVGDAIRDASTALLNAEVERAEQTIDADRAIDALYRDIEQRALDLLARQQPVASDLRQLVSSLRMVADLERAADYAVHVAEVARRRYPTSAIPPALHDTFERFGRATEQLARKTGQAIEHSSLDLADELEADDDEIDSLHKELFTRLLGGEWEGGLEPAIDVILCGRYYERLADHLVLVARRIRYQVTGVRPGRAPA